MMQNVLIVGIGGFLGSILRYILSALTQKWSDGADFPYGILVVNLLGCLAIGMLSRMDEMKNILSPEVRLLLFIGILGAFTTFSTFGNDTVNLISGKKMDFAILNVGAHVVFGLAAVMAGRYAGNFFWG